MQTVLQILTIVLSGAAAASIVFALYNAGIDSVFKKRLTQVVRQGGLVADSPLSKTTAPTRVASIINILSKLSLPEEGWQSSGVQLKFLQAGIRHKKTPIYYFAVKTMLTIVLPGLLAIFLYFTRPDISFTLAMFMVLFTAVAGYYLPELLLRVITQKRVERMRDSLSDMMDLIVVCTEAGMSVDAAITRISREMAQTDPELAQEFYLASLEMRAGATRIDALRNLALRSRLEEMDDLVSVLVQADRFGSSLAEALRVHSDMMRSRRSQRAEEIAAKIPVKVALPLVLFIFPTLFLVMLGPAIIQTLEIFSNQPKP
ncbi:type II secretion system F family protein [Chlorobaculum sp. 24CR]|uniref:type II secretion system F family protein n=1 Tax=Chlorobaculum sp. 24CR TaxID=2508878 RepID=UPI00100AD413|nr:type II secretion system F family protein [Chlorobaculum sp. 24CR]RXK80020.1 type II secretion system F family protein [Chlorobaculum sp. 24CR]